MLIRKKNYLPSQKTLMNRHTILKGMEIINCDNRTKKQSVRKREDKMHIIMLILTIIDLAIPDPVPFLDELALMYLTWLTWPDD